MAGYVDILDSFISGQNQALANQMDLARLRETQNQNRVAQSNWRQQFAADEQQRARTNQYNQGMLELQQNTDQRAESTFDRENAERDLQQNLGFAIQSLDFTKDNWTPEDALDPNKEGGWRALNNIPEVRELLGGEIRLAVVPGSEDREDGPIYSFQVFNDKTGTAGPLTTLRGNQQDEFVVFHDREGVTRELNNIKNLVRSRLGVDPRYVTDASVALMQQGSEAEAAATQTIPEIKPFGSEAINAERMGTTASTQNDIQGLGPVGTGAVYSGTVAQGNAVANSAPTSTTTVANSAPVNNGALGTPRVATNPNPANSVQGNAINQRLQVVSNTISQLEADYANARGQNPVQATQIYQQLQAAYNEQQQLADQYAQIGGPLVSSSQAASQSTQPTQFNQQTTGALGAPRVVTQPASAPATAAAASTTSQTSNSAAAPVIPATPLGGAGATPPMGYGSEERIARSAATLAQPFLDQANGAREAYNAAASYRGIVPNAQQLEAVNFSRRSKNITDAQASNLLSDGDMTGARTNRAGQRMTESRAIMTNATDNARQVVTNIQDNNKDVTKTWLTEAAGIRKKQMDIEADILKSGDANTREAYSFLTDSIAPQVMEQLQIPEEQRGQLTGVMTNVWATLPDIPGPNGTKISLRSNDAGQQQRIATGVVRAYNELDAYNDGAQLNPYGFFKWMKDVVTPDILRDWARTDFNTAELNGTAFAAYAMSGLDPRNFADIVLEPMSAAKGKVSPLAFKKLMGSIMLFEQSQGRAPTQDDIRRLVTLTAGGG